MPTFRQIYLPYALVPLGDRWFLPVGRNYKPIGFPDGWYDYGHHPSRIRIKDLTPNRAKAIGLRASGGVDPVEGAFLYLYNDATNPELSVENMRRYEAILAKLMKLEVNHSVERRDVVPPLVPATF